MIDAHIASLIKGMLARGDKQHDIAACFGENGGRIAEIKTGQRWRDALVAPLDDLPPPGPYATPYELFAASRGLWAVRVALTAAHEKIGALLTVIENAELRLRSGANDAEAAE
jgi:hypothetical protein